MARGTAVLLLVAVAASMALSVDVGSLGTEIAAECFDEGCARLRLVRALGGRGDESLARLLSRQTVSLNLPPALGATLVFRPGRGLDFDVQFPPEPQEQPREDSEARDMMKKNGLMPLLMLIKLKLKLITPILLAVVGLKAMKALILSKLAILLVVGFLIVQLCQKLGMAKMNMTPAAPSTVDPTPMAPMYGPPTTSGYEAPPASSWEPAAPYQRIYEPSNAHQLAYSAYASQNN